MSLCKQTPKLVPSGSFHYLLVHLLNELIAYLFYFQSMMMIHDGCLDDRCLDDSVKIYVKLNALNGIVVDIHAFHSFEEIL